MEQKRRKVILDCDPGHDDAIAIVIAGASPLIDLLGITVEQGNQLLEKTGRNALNLVQFLSLDVLVSLGANHPLKCEPRICPEIHGETGLDGFIFPPLERSFHKDDAVDLMKRLIEQNDKVTLVATGPLTNVALFLLKYPHLKSKIEDIVIMGGSIGLGNITPAAEFNILCDPEAADIVFNCGVNIHMMGLDVTRKVLVTPEIISRMGNINNKVGKMFKDLMVVFNENQLKTFGIKAAPLHDPVTMVYLIDPSSVTTKYANVEIDCSGGPSYGRTNIDIYNYQHKKPNAYVAVDIDTNKYWDILEEAIKSYS